MTSIYVYGSKYSKLLLHYFVEMVRCMFSLTQSSGVLWRTCTASHFTRCCIDMSLLFEAQVEIRLFPSLAKFKQRFAA